MKIITKFDIGDNVSIITNQPRVTYTECGICGGVGSITCKKTDKIIPCPMCYQGKIKHIGDYEWHVIENCIVVEIQTFNCHDKHQNSQKVKIQEPSSLHTKRFDVDRVFMKTEHAKLECAKLISEGLI